MKAIGRILAALFRGLVVRFTWIPTHAKCPRCGHFRGGIAFDHDKEVIIHCCAVCRALWGEEPLVKRLGKRTTNA